MEKAHLPLIVAICGGSCSGKTTSAKLLTEHFGADHCAILYQDHYYRDQSDKFDFDGGAINFDHPDAIEFSLLKDGLIKLKKGIPCKIPQYNFATHAREKTWPTFTPKKIILVDGILILHALELRELFDLKIFFSAESDVRLKRRIKRDVSERGRTPEGVQKQFDLQVTPMHQQFVEPSKAYADLIYENESEETHEVFLQKVIHQIKNLLG